METGAESDTADGSPFRRTLDRWQLTLMGISYAIGAGALVLTGTMAANHAGPAASVSFAIAGVVCLLVALCYAELASMMPDAGSAYTYARRSTGRAVSWLVGWCLIMGYLVAAATVAVGWSGYFANVLGSFGLRLPQQLLAAPVRVSADLSVDPSGAWFNLPAAAIVAICTLFLLRGVRESARMNTAMVALKLGAILLFILFGLFFVDPANWSPFLPPGDGKPGRFGASGLFAASVLAFFAFTGFEVISTSTQEAQDPDRDIPFALIASFSVCAVLYIAIALVMTGMVPFRLLADPSPLAFAIGYAAPGHEWLGLVITLLVVLGLPSAVLVGLYGQTRIFAVMSNDGLLPAQFGRIHPRHRVPYAGTIIVGVLAALIAALLPIEILGELVSMGLLFCFAIVCLAVILLRRAEPDTPRPFRVPFYPVTPALGCVACVYLVFSLPVETWLRLAAWLVAGGLIYLLYCRRRAR